MTDPIREAEDGVKALASFEKLAEATVNGTITVNVRAGDITSIAATRILRPEDVPDAGPIAAIADDMRWGAVDLEVVDGRIVDWVALPRRKIA
jgi:hypothetical protein